MLNYRRPFGVEPEFFVPLFVEPDPNLKLPTVGELLKRMFKDQQISFKKVNFSLETLLLFVATVYISDQLESQWVHYISRVVEACHLKPTAQDSYNNAK